MPVRYRLALRRHGRASPAEPSRNDGRIPQLANAADRKPGTDRRRPADAPDRQDTKREGLDRRGILRAVAQRRRSERRVEVVATGLAELVPDRDRSTAWTLLLDGAPQSYVDLADPTHLEFEYVRRMAAAIDLIAPPGQPLRALPLGGGALTLPRYVAATRPGSAQRAVEIDGPLVDLIRRSLPWDPTIKLRVRVADAREALAGMRDGGYDLVVIDVFAGARTPAHLASVEFIREVARVI